MMPIRTEETIREIELAAARRMERAAEVGRLLADLTTVRDQVTADTVEVERQLGWWSDRSPDHQITDLLAAAATQLRATLDEAEGKVIATARDQQTHEQVAADLRDRAAEDRRDWERQQGGERQLDLVDSTGPGAPETTPPGEPRQAKHVAPVGQGRRVRQAGRAAQPSAAGQRSRSPPGWPPSPPHSSSPRRAEPSIPPSAGTAARRRGRGQGRGRGRSRRGRQGMCRRRHPGRRSPPHQGPPHQGPPAGCGRRRTDSFRRRHENARATRDQAGHGTEPDPR